MEKAITLRAKEGKYRPISVHPILLKPLEYLWRESQRLQEGKK